MFLDELVDQDCAEARGQLEAWLRGLAGLKRTYTCAIADAALAGVPAIKTDIYTDLGLGQYDKTGGLFLRIYSVGEPAHFLYGMYTGGERLEENPAYDASTYVRGRVEGAIAPLLAAPSPAFETAKWTRTIPWLSTGTALASVTRQFNYYVVHKNQPAPTAAERNAILGEMEMLLRCLDAAIDLITPVREFGRGLIRAVYEVNLPAPSFPVNWAGAPSALPGGCPLLGLDENYRQAIAALRAGKSVVLIGPPGTGKSELAQWICQTLNAPFDLVTATSDWSTFDTIGGYFPDPMASATNGQEPLSFSPGVVLQSLEKPAWLIIDELNRADIDKAFGEFFTILGGSRKSVALPFKRRTASGLRSVVIGEPVPGDPGAYVYEVPRDWRLIGTMNTFDKASLYQMSYAFMRRFAFIDIPPLHEAEYRHLIENALSELTNPTDSAFHDEMLRLYLALFTPAPNNHVAKLGLLVGPAIPLDMAAYLVQRYEQTSRAARPDEAQAMVLEGLELYLYPQFEGRNQDHADIIRVLADVLALSADEEAATDRRLATWTGGRT